MLDLKDAFISMLLATQSQIHFVFEWASLTSMFNGQLTWTCQTQEFKNSPTLFDEALHADFW